MRRNTPIPPARTVRHLNRKLITPSPSPIDSHAAKRLRRHNAVMREEEDFDNDGPAGSQYVWTNSLPAKGPTTSTQLASNALAPSAGSTDAVPMDVDKKATLFQHDIILQDGPNWDQIEEVFRPTSS